MLTALIVEDEKLVSETLKKLLADNYPDISVLSTLGTLGEANYYLKHITPDILFLDVNLPDGLGINLECLQSAVEFDVIFCTAHEGYAVDAFKLNAADFLLKPFKREEFMRVMNQVVPKRLESIRHENEPEFMEHSPSRQKMLVHTQEGIEFMSLNDIIYLKAKQNYTEFYLEGGKYLLSSKTLKEFDKVLSQKGFARIHQSFLINLDHVSKYLKGKGGKVVMDNGDELDVAQNRKEFFLNSIKHLFLTK